MYNVHHYNYNNISIHINSYISRASMTHHPGVHVCIIKQYFYLRKHNQTCAHIRLYKSYIEEMRGVSYLGIYRSECIILL